MTESASLEQKKIEAADAVLDSLDEQKGGLHFLASQFGLNKEMRENAKAIILGEKEETNDVLGNLKSSILEKISVGYDKQDLLRLKRSIGKASSENELQSIVEKEKGNISNNEKGNRSSGPDEGNPTTPEDVEKFFNDADNREKIDIRMQKVTNKKIRYRMGSKNGDRGYLDCSGLINYVFKKAGYAVPALNSRELFTNQNIAPQKVEIEDKKIKKTSSLETIKTGDLIFWNATNKKYQRSGGGLSNIKRDGNTYRIHHVAFVKKINFDEGTISIVESTPQYGVHETTIDPKEIRNGSVHKSDLYVAHLDYSDPQRIFAT